MKQLLQNLRTGEGTVAEVPVPIVQSGRVLVRTEASLISAGTERALAELGQKGLLGKARERPELIGKVFEKVKTDGLAQAIEGVRDKLDQSHPVGYSAAGIVIETAKDVAAFRAGDRVACAGTDYASHAEVISVPRNLCVPLSDQLSFEEGAFGTVGAIALQGVRLAEPTIGESVVVIGLGLVGQLIVQLLKANGCRVFGIDIDEARVQLARTCGADDGCVPDDAKAKVMAWSRERGADGCIIAAAAASSEPVELAGEISRLKGRVVAVGMVGMKVPRNVYYQRELTLKVSMSYGPGRNDPDYEERGHDYPFAYVRWTEGRNIEAFLDLLAAGRVDVMPLITHRFAIEDARRAYQLISGGTDEKYLAVVLTYDAEKEISRRIENKAAVPNILNVHHGLDGFDVGLQLVKPLLHQLLEGVGSVLEDAEYAQEVVDDGDHRKHPHDHARDLGHPGKQVQDLVVEPILGEFLQDLGVLVDVLQGFLDTLHGVLCRLGIDRQLEGRFVDGLGVRGSLGHGPVAVEVQTTTEVDGECRLGHGWAPVENEKGGGARRSRLGGDVRCLFDAADAGIVVEISESVRKKAPAFRRSQPSGSGASNWTLVQLPQAARDGLGRRSAARGATR